MRLTPAQTKAAQAAETDEVFIILVEIHHPNFPTPFYMTENTETIVHGGNDYVSWPFKLILSYDDGEKLPEVFLTIANVDLELVRIIRETVEPPTMVIKMVTASEPDAVSLHLSGLTLRDVDYDAQLITWVLHADSLADSRYPADTISLASGYLGLFRS